MVKVIYPGPAVQGEAKFTPQYFGALEVSVVPGENELPELPAKALIALGQVVPAATDAPAQPVKETATEATPDLDPEAPARGRRRVS